MIAEVVVPASVVAVWAGVLAAALTAAFAAPVGWWTVPAFWLASTAVSAGIYLVDANADDYLFGVRAVLATVVCGLLAISVSRRSRPRAPVWATLPAALAGVVTPPAFFLALLVIACDNGACLS